MMKEKKKRASTLGLDDTNDSADPQVERAIAREKESAKESQKKAQKMSFFCDFVIASRL